MNYHNISTDFFAWDTGNVSSILWKNLNSTTAHDVYFWGGIILFVLLFLWPFVGPFFAAFILYINALILVIYKLKHYKNSQYSLLDETGEKNITCKYWSLVSSIWHGHEVIGWENVPNTRTIFITYHGAFALDIVYFYAKLTLFAGEKLCYMSGHKQQAEIPGWRTFHRVINCLPYNQDDCVEILNNDCYLLLLPGGMPESRFSNNKYRVHFDGRKGFADVILKANDKVTIIPVFTRNIQEAFWVPWFVHPIVSGKYAPKHIPFSPMGGGLPVKLTTFLGPPIEYEKTLTRDQLSEKIINALQEHIDRHQRVPGNRLYALMERFCGRCTVQTSKIEREQTIA